MMFFTEKFVKCLLTLVFAGLLGACSDGNNVAQTTAQSSSTALNGSAKPALIVYKSETCGCCKKWVEHLNENGFVATPHNSVDLSTLKTDKGIAPRYQSCHTGVSADGYVFEGHIPAKYIKQFLQNPPADALGLSVPAMPVGSPGMEVGDKFMPYNVLLLKSDGSVQTYAKIKTAQQQY
ncbi:MAG: hypothetical protein ACI9FJ_000108 [Alteromonadaceae bacterium]|jgi:hypothetical protein